MAGEALNTGQLATIEIWIKRFKNAHAVIIVDRERNAEKDVTKLIMSDEHNFGNAIKIPSILINYNDGKVIEDSLKSGPVVAELVWDIPVNNVLAGLFFILDTVFTDESGSLESFEKAVVTELFSCLFQLSLSKKNPGSGNGSMDVCILARSNRFSQRL